ncbi:MAG: hypothetical protein K0V04_02705 [Deltaproteobacteria bacterium]|nr:hypothetical protein [Deltaproteobacteria bacterium]
MTRDEALPHVQALVGPGQDLEGMELTRLWPAYVELPDEDPERPCRVRDVRVWRADLRGPRGYARVAIDDRDGTLLRTERM